MGADGSFCHNPLPSLLFSDVVGLPSKTQFGFKILGGLYFLVESPWEGRSSGCAQSRARGWPFSQAAAHASLSAPSARVAPVFGGIPSLLLGQRCCSWDTLRWLHGVSLKRERAAER